MPSPYFVTPSFSLFLLLHILVFLDCTCRGLPDRLFQSFLIASVPLDVEVIDALYEKIKDFQSFLIASDVIS